MDFNLQANQRVQISGPRGSREDGIVLGITRSGKVLVQNLSRNNVEVVDREDIYE